MADSSSEEDKIINAIESVIESLEFSEIEEYLKQLNFTEKPFKEIIVELIYNGAQSSLSEIYQNFKSAFLAEISDFIPQIISILCVIIFLSITKATAPDGQKSIVDIAAFIGNLMVIGIVFAVFVQLYNLTKDTVASLSKQIQILFPIILTLMTASGGVNSVGVFKPVVSVLTNGISLLFENLLFPIVIFILAFSAINSFSSSIKTDKMIDFLKSIFKWIIGVSSVLFGFFITAQGISASIFDAVSIKALKYAVSNSVPLINNLVSSGFDVVVAACVLVKNSIGLLSLICIIFIVVMPLFKLVIFSLLLKLLAAVTQSIAADSTIKFISGSSEGVSYLATILCVSAIIYLITVLIFMCCLGVSI